MSLTRIIRNRLLLLGGIGLFLVLVFFLIGRFSASQPIGTGERIVSPDGQFTASVTDYFAESFWSGAERRWFEFRVNGPDLDRSMTTEPIPGPYFGSRSDHRVIYWDPDSRAVRFVFPRITIRIETGPEESPSSGP